MRKSYRDREPVTIESNSVDTTTTDGEAEKRIGRGGGRRGRGEVDGEYEGRPMTRRKYLAADGELSRGERQSRVPPAGN